MALLPTEYGVPDLLSPPCNVYTTPSPLLGLLDCTVNIVNIVSTVIIVNIVNIVSTLSAVTPCSAKEPLTTPHVLWTLLQR